MGNSTPQEQVKLLAFEHAPTVVTPLVRSTSHATPEAVWVCAVLAP